MKKFYTLLTVLFCALTLSVSAQETVIAVWDFVDGSTVGVNGDGFATTGGNSLGWLKNGDQSGVSDPNSVVCAGRNNFSGAFLQDLDIDSNDLVDGKLHLSITFNNIDLTAAADGTASVMQFFLKGAGNPNYANNHRMVGLKLTHDAAGAGDIKIESLVLNNGVQYGGQKDVGGLGSSAIYSGQLTIGTTMDFTNQTSSFWVGSPGQYSETPFGLTTATSAANQSTAWNEATQTMAPSAIIKSLQFQTKSGLGSVEVDQFKVSTGTYENTVAEGDAPPAPTSALMIQGVLDIDGGNKKAVHVRATEDIADLSIYKLKVYANANTTSSASYTFSGTASAGDDILIANDGDALEAYMSASTIFDSVDNTGGFPSINGNDSIELLMNDLPVEVYGEIGTDGSGQTWEYADSWAYKDDGAWTYGGVNCTDGSTTTWDSSCVYPLAIGNEPFTSPTWAGDWLLDPVAGALAVGPNAGSVGQWYASSAADVDTRACLFDDIHRFNADGTYQQIMQDQTWLEGWQGVTEGCGTPIAPHDGSNAATYTYTGETVTVIGDGAFMGLAKVHNTGEDGVSGGSITYNIVSVDENYLVVNIQYAPGADNTWQFRFRNANYTPPTTDVTFTVNTEGIEVGPNGMYLGGGILGGAQAYAMTDADADGTWEVTLTLNEGTTGNYIFLNSPNDGGDWGAKEVLTGQECADGAFDDRLLAPVGADDYTLQHCFGSCDTDGTCSSLGIDDAELSQFTYFPNPVNNVLTIKAQASIDNITVYNMLGQAVVRATPNTNNSTVDMSELQTGAYFVQVSIDNTLKTVRVIKN